MHKMFGKKMKKKAHKKMMGIGPSDEDADDMMNEAVGAKKEKKKFPFFKKRMK